MSSAFYAGNHRPSTRSAVIYTQSTRARSALFCAPLLSRRNDKTLTSPKRFAGTLAIANSDKMAPMVISFVTGNQNKVKEVEPKNYYDYISLRCALLLVAC
jgi:hypothetical protein